MTDPKLLFRTLDQLIGQLSVDSGAGDFLGRALAAIESHLGPTVGLVNGRLYRESGDRFVRYRPRSVYESPAHLRVGSAILRLTAAHGNYVFDGRSHELPLAGEGEDPITPPNAAVVVEGPTYPWLFVFDLKGPWDHDSVIAAMNAIRFMLTSRLRELSAQDDLARAAEIQESMLPHGPPTFDGYEIAACSQPATVVGGDVYDFLALDDGRLGLVVGDAAGHGLPAAMVARDLVIGLRLGRELSPDMLNVITRLNGVIYRSGYSSRFISICYGALAPDGALRIVNAGHVPPIIVGPDSSRELEATGMILGAVPHVDLEVAEHRLEPGEVLVMLTDGITERSRGRELMGTDAIVQLVAEGLDRTAADLAGAIFTAAHNYGRREAWEDDATVVVVKRLSPSPDTASQEA